MRTRPDDFENATTENTVSAGPLILATLQSFSLSLTLSSGNINNNRLIRMRTGMIHVRSRRQTVHCLTGVPSVVSRANRSVFRNGTTANIRENLSARVHVLRVQQLGQPIGGALRSLFTVCVISSFLVFICSSECACTVFRSGLRVL